MSRRKEEWIQWLKKNNTSLNTVCIKMLSGSSLHLSFLVQPQILGNSLSFLPLLKCFLAKSRASPRVRGARMLAVSHVTFYQHRVVRADGELRLGSIASPLGWTEVTSSLLRLVLSTGDFSILKVIKKRSDFKSVSGERNWIYSHLERWAAPLCVVGVLRY